MNSQVFYEKYGNIKVRFSVYYQYTFTYTAFLQNGHRLICDYGGDAESIYQHPVAVNREVLVADLRPYSGFVLDENNHVIERYLGAEK